LQELPMYKDLLKWFITQELVRWPKLNELYHEELSQQHTALFPPLSTPLTLTPSQPVSSEYSIWLELQKRVVEHNIRVVAKYYARITSKRLAELLDLHEDDSERFISDLVGNGTIFAKIDRPNHIIVFQKQKQPNEVLNEWSQNISNLLDTLEKTTHLIHRELMVHGNKK